VSLRFPESSPVEPPAIAAAAQVLRQGGVVAFPTETYYGLAADVGNEYALERIFLLKERQQGKPLLTLIAERAQLSSLTLVIPSPYERLMAAFWPGPLTLLFPARPELSAFLTGGTGTVGARISSHPVAREFVAAFGAPLTATSANRSGMPAACSAEEVRAQLGAGILPDDITAN